MRRPLTPVIAGVAACALLVFAAPTAAQAGTRQAHSTAATQSAAKPAAVTTADLAQSGADQQRWLSVPDSRIVMNPFNDDTGGSEVSQNSGPQLPLTAGYYVNDQAPTSPGLLQTYRRTGVTTTQPTPPTTGFTDDFATMDPAWTLTNASAVSNGTSATVTNTGSKTYGYISRQVTVDLSKTPVLAVSMLGAVGGWSVKVNDGTLASDLKLQRSTADTSQTGTITFDVGAATGWTGQKTFTLRLFANDTGSTKGDFTVDQLQFQSRPELPSAASPGTEQTVGFSDDFSDASAWSAGSNLTLTSQGGLGTLTLGNADYSPISRQVTADVSANPILSISVPWTNGSWSLKVSKGGSDGDVELQHDTDTPGVYSYNLAALTGWSGSTTFTIRLYEIGNGTKTIVDAMSLHSGEVAVESAASSSTTWQPDRLGFTADYTAGSVTGDDQFHDVNSITRLITTDGVAAGGGALVMAGSWTGTPAYDATHRILTITTPTYTYAVAIPGDADAEFFSTTASLLAGGTGTSAPTGSSGTWSVSLPDGTYATGVGFAPGTTPDDAAQADASATAAADVSTAKADQVTWQKYWDGVLARVPAAADYSIRSVDALGVTPDQVKAQYYRAWWNLQANVLPATPETGNTKAQVATGKASLWLNGSTSTKDEASWDSLLGMQYLVHIDPDDAWQAFQGMMGEVQPDGKLGGESLPSRKAQTAWVLYQATGDKAKLGGVYDELVSNLNWEEQNPRWILGSYDHPDERDAEFVVSLLVDLGYAEDISTELGHADDVAHWKDMRASVLTDYENWFFPGNGVSLYKHYLNGSQPDDPGTGLSMYVLTGLHVPGLDDATLKTLKDRFASEFDLNQQFAGLADTAIKAPDAMFILYGLLDQGMTSQADQFNNVMIRDIVRTGWFAEVYQQSSASDADTPLVSGVRPSLFGITNLIDSVWVNNGYRADQGTPSFVRTNGTSTGGVSGLSLDGKTLNENINPDVLVAATTPGTKALVATNPTAGSISVSGDAVSARAQCATIAAPVGTTVTLPTDCLASNDTGTPGGGDPGDGPGTNPGTGTSTGGGNSGSSGSSASAHDGLADTGSDIIGWLALAIAALAAGAVALSVRSRRARRS